MVDTKKYSEWFKKACQDLRSAKILFAHEGDMWIVAFHCQQAVEKYLKGFILFNIQELTEGHNLYKLCKKCIDIDPEFKPLLKDCGFLSNYYIETRYPSDDEVVVNIEEANECILVAERLIEMVDKLLSGEKNASERV